GLQLFSSSTTDLVAYSDADWAGFPTTRRSTFEVEYRGIANAVAETCWLRNLLLPLGFPPKVHYTPIVPAGPNSTAPYNYNMMSAQSNVTPTGPPSQPTSITIQPGNVGLTTLSGQATTIPHAFTTETLWDLSNGAWNMDTLFHHSGCKGPTYHYDHPTLPPGHPHCNLTRL
nr:ribonuclease H-like domain-containing protein [Tanacetum cinerariifolium]